MVAAACRGPGRGGSAEQQPLLGGQAPPVHLVLLQLLVVGVPELRDDPLHVQGVHGVRGDDLPVHLGSNEHVSVTLQDTDFSRT